MILTRASHFYTLAGTAALALSCFAVLPAQAAPAGMPTFGSVDINKVQSQSTKKAKYDSDLHAMADKLDFQFKQQAASFMLTQAEQTELGGLLSKPSQSDSDKARITALQTESSKAVQDLTDLQQVKSPTATDTENLNTLTKQVEAGKAALQQVGDAYQTQLKALSDQDNADFTRSVKESISYVALQKGLSVVFTSDVAIYTVNDITDDVVKRINK